MDMSFLPWALSATGFDLAAGRIRAAAPPGEVAHGCHELRGSLTAVRVSLATMERRRRLLRYIWGLSAIRVRTRTRSNRTPARLRDKLGVTGERCVKRVYARRPDVPRSVCAAVSWQSDRRLLGRSVPAVDHRPDGRAGNRA
jgi:hypothetical protein